ncbi:MAG: hypothetical protein JWO51_1129 [Rhodospirillales bacterium]|nr:hypothetical protein [Rhodospirillales bacterium]
MTDGRAKVRALRRAGNLCEARIFCELLIDTGQDVWDLLAEIDQDEGRYAEAIAAWDRAIGLGARAAPTLAAKANLLLELGRIDEADQGFERALAVAPDHGPALYGRASIASLRREAPDIARWQTLLDRGPSDEDRFHLHFMLGRAFLEGDDPEPAFRHFAAGNVLRRAAFNYDVAEDERLMAAIADAFPVEVIADAGDPSEAPIFIVGMPRSGSSLLEQILAAHPAIHGAGELLHIKHLIIREFADKGPFPASMADRTPAQLRALGRQYLDATAALAPGARRIVDKLPLNFYFAGLIHLMLPNARIIHIWRDPLDTCLSCHTTLFREPVRFVHDQTELGRFHRAYESLIAHWGRVLPASRFTEVDYGDLVADPEAETRRLLAFCGVAWDAACLRPQDASRAIRTASRLQARQPVYRSSVGRARRYRDYLGPLIAALGL